MRLEESGTFVVKTTSAEALAYLTDTEAVPHCLPGEIHSVTHRDDGGVTVEMTASYGGASQKVRVRFYVDTVDEDATRVEYSGHGLGSRVKIDLAGEFSLEETEDGLHVEWLGTADVGGLIGSLNRGIADAAIRDKLDKTAENVRSELQHSSAGRA